MNCLCGYEGKDFINVQTITRRTNTYNEEMKDYEYEHFRLVACPKCGTVKLAI